MQACQYGHWEVVQTLILFGANVRQLLASLVSSIAIDMYSYKLEWNRIMMSYVCGEMVFRFTEQIILMGVLHSTWLP